MNFFILLVICNFTELSHNILLEHLFKKLSIEEQIIACKKRVELYNYMATSELVRYYEYTRIFKTPLDIYDFSKLDAIFRHWNELYYLEKRYPSEEDKKSKFYQKMQKNAYNRYNSFFEGLKSPSITFSFRDEVINRPILPSFKYIYKDKVDFVETYGINPEWSVPQRHFFQRYQAEDIAKEIYLELDERIKIDSLQPVVSDIKELGEKLKIYAIEYKSDCSDNDFHGLKIVFKTMVELILQSIKFSSLENYKPPIYCGLAFFTTSEQEQCRRYKKSFAYITLSHAKLILPEVAK